MISSNITTLQKTLFLADENEGRVIVDTHDRSRRIKKTNKALKDHTKISQVCGCYRNQIFNWTLPLARKKILNFKNKICANRTMEVRDPHQRMKDICHVQKI
jgi:hypothetical protein